MASIWVRFGFVFCVTHVKSTKRWVRFVKKLYAPAPTAMSTCSGTRNLHHQFVVQKRRKFFAIALLTVIGGVVAYLSLNRKDEPKFEGRYLSEWYEVMHKSNDGAALQIAVRNIGSNALPHYLRWIHDQSPAWWLKLRRSLPKSVPGRKSVDRWLDSDESRVNDAYTGFWFLGKDAASVIPTSTLRMRPRPQWRTIPGFDVPRAPRDLTDSTTMEVARDVLWYASSTR
jgi:hypothetical protein